MEYDDENIFAKILRGEIPCSKVHEDKWSLAFHDISPQTPIHILVVPKGRYVSIDDFSKNASKEEIKDTVLQDVNVKRVVNSILNNDQPLGNDYFFDLLNRPLFEFGTDNTSTFIEAAHQLSDAYKNQISLDKSETNIGACCSKCTFCFQEIIPNYNPQENFYFAKQNSNFQVNPNGRCEGTYTKYSSLDDKFDGFHYYTWYIKTGRGRATEDAAIEVRNKIITREEAVSLVKKYDGEFPKIYLKDFLEHTNLSEKKFHEIIDKFRPPHLWEKIKGKWVLKKTVWKNE